MKQILGEGGGGLHPHLIPVATALEMASMKLSHYVSYTVTSLRITELPKLYNFNVWNYTA
jgi:hypothetical protein